MEFALKPMSTRLQSSAFCAVVSGTAAIFLLLCAISTPALALPKAAVPQNAIRTCDQYPGEDAGEKIQLCIRDLPASGGTADARGIGGVQRISKTLVLDKPGVYLLLAPGTEFILGDGAYIDLTGYGAVIRGGGVTTIFRAGKNSGFRIGNTKAQSKLWVLEGFKISGLVNTRGGITMQNATAGVLKDLWVSGFAIGLDVQEDCWSIRVVDTHVEENDMGYKFSGANANGWNIRGGWITNNRVGIEVDLRRGTMQGLSITDGTQMEGNRDSAIVFSSGVVDGFEIANVYVETKVGQRFLTVAGNGDSPVTIPLLLVRGGFIDPLSTVPFLLQARKMDTVNVLIADLLIVHGGNLMRVADVSGNAHVKIENTISVSPSGTYTAPFQP